MITTQRFEHFIKSVADQEGAHADETRSAMLEMAHGISLGTRSLHSQLLAAIADAVVDNIAICFIAPNGAQVMNDFAHARAERGRGVVTVDLYDFCLGGLGGVDLEFVPTDEVAGISEDERQMIKSHDSDKGFLLVRRLLNGQMNITSIEPQSC